MPDDAKPPAEQFPRRMALRVVMMPRDTNPYGTVFGGVVLSHIDQAAFVEARHHGCHRWVTASIQKVDFHEPVHLGDVVGFYTQTISTGRSSVRVRVNVQAERHESSEVVPVTTAELTMVAVGPDGRSIDFRDPPTIGPAPGLYTRRES